MSEEIEVPIEEVDPKNPKPMPSITEGLRRLMLASLGAAAITRDEFEGLVQKLVDRGELAQKDGEKMITEVQKRFFRNDPPTPQASSSISERLEHGFDDVLRRLNIPTRRDVEDLTTKIQKLSQAIEELREKQ